MIIERLIFNTDGTSYIEKIEVPDDYFDESEAEPTAEELIDIMLGVTSNE